MEFFSKTKYLILSILRILKYIFIISSVSLSMKTWASEDARTARPAFEYAHNFGAMYGAQWAFYLISQKETIEQHGSFDHWVHYPTQLVFDKDSFDFNIFKHSLAGQYYYLFYRHQGYDEFEAFTWTFISSLAFEFTVETYTEKPSIQDIYQTPIYGTILGMGSERFSTYLLSQDSYLAQFFGYVVNPFNLFRSPNSTSLTAHPAFNKGAPGFVLSWRF